MTTPPDEAYTYRLTLDELDDALATFRYTDAPAPQRGDTRLALTRPSWDRMGRPLALHVTLSTARTASQERPQ